MKIECWRKLKKDGKLGFVWRAKFQITLKNNSLDEEIKEPRINYLDKLGPVFCIFQNWALEQADCPKLGHISSVEINTSSFDENLHLLAGKILTELKESFYEINFLNVRKE